MNTYVFFYSTSHEDYVSLNLKPFKTKTSRFIQAFRQFKDFLKNHPSDYISYGHSYHVISDRQDSHRLLSDAHTVQLANIKYNHNLYSEVEDDEIF